MRRPRKFNLRAELIFFCFVCTAVSEWSLTNAEEEFEDYYTVLEVEKHATPHEIKRSYRRLSLEKHPDKALPSEAAKAAKQFHRITEAYEVLSKPRKRRLYDLYGKEYAYMEDYFDEIPRRGGVELYKYKKGVFLLFERNLDGLLTHSPFTWILTFAQPGCGNCEKNVPVFSRLGEKTMETKNIRLAIVNCLMSNLCHYFGIDHLGQVFFLSPDQDGGGYWDKKEYTGPLVADRILEAATAVPPPNMLEIESDALVAKKLSEMSVSPRPAALTTVSAVDAAWFVNYYKPSCLACRQTKSELRQVSSELREKLTFSFVNCDKHDCADVPYFPYARLFVKHHDLSISQVPIDLRRASRGAASAAVLAAVSILTHLLHMPHKNPARTRSQRAEEF